MKKAKLKPADVKAIGLSGQMHGSVFLDKNRQGRSAGRSFGTTSGPPPSAPRSKQRAGGRGELIRMVANPALTGFTAPKILWLRNHEPRHFDEDQESAAAQG